MVLSCMERRRVQTPVTGMVVGMAFVLAIDLNQEEDARSLYLHLDRVERRGQGLGSDAYLSLFDGGAIRFVVVEKRMVTFPVWRKAYLTSVLKPSRCQ